MKNGRKAGTGVLWKRLIKKLYEQAGAFNLREQTIDIDWTEELNILDNRIEQLEGFAGDPSTLPDYIRYSRRDKEISIALEEFFRKLKKG
jgi:hypothetical protein